MLAGPDPGPLPVLALDRAARALAGGRRPAAAWFAANAPIRRVDVTARQRARPAARAAAGGVGPAADRALRRRRRPSRACGSPAAADNASGVAVVLEAARLLAARLPDGVGLSVALLDGEEVGALGSAHHAAQLPDRRDAAGHQRRRRRPPARGRRGRGRRSRARAARRARPGRPAHRAAAAGRAGRLGQPPLRRRRPGGGRDRRRAWPATTARPTPPTASSRPP